MGGEPEHHLPGYTAGPWTISHRFQRETSELFCPLGLLVHWEALFCQGWNWRDWGHCVGCLLTAFQGAFWVHFPHKIKLGSAPFTRSWPSAKPLLLMHMQIKSHEAWGLFYSNTGKLYTFHCLPESTEGVVVEDVNSKGSKVSCCTKKVRVLFATLGTCFWAMKTFSSDHLEMNSDWKCSSKENYLKICRFLAVCNLCFFFLIYINVNLFLLSA